MTVSTGAGDGDGARKKWQRQEGGEGERKRNNVNSHIYDSIKSSKIFKNKFIQRSERFIHQKL